MTSSKQNETFDHFWLNRQFSDENEKIIKRPHELVTEKTNYPPLPIAADILNRIRGSLFGLALGDALGAHVEFRPYSFLKNHKVVDLQGGGTWGLERGQFTDDTSMALCLASSLIASEGFCPYDQLVRYKWWYRYGYMSSTGHCFDIGAGTRRSIQEFESRQRKFAEESELSLEDMDDTQNPEIFERFDVDCGDADGAGNGSLMRLAPVPLFFYRNPENAVLYSGKSSQITHASDKACDACRYYGALIVAALQGEPKENLLNKEFLNKYQSWFGDKPLHPDIRDIANGSYQKPNGYEDGIRGKGYVVKALEAALWAFWSDENSFKTGALKAVNLGDDTDTTAAIYGQLAGAVYGYDELPKEWVSDIYAKDFIDCISHWIAYGEGNYIQEEQSPERLTLFNSSSIGATRSITTSLFRETIIGMSTSKMNYKAVDISGCLGDFYDACDEKLVKPPKDISIEVLDQSGQPHIQCEIKSGDTFDWPYLFRFLGFHNDLWLSILSSIVSPAGVAAVINYPFIFDENTRIFYYSYTVPKACVLDDKYCTSISSSIKASHIVTTIGWGVEVVAIIKLPSGNSKEMDNLLKIMCTCLSENKPLTISIEQINLSTQPHIYSNVTNFTQCTTVNALYTKICECQQNIMLHKPCYYELYKITYLYSHEKRKDLKFVAVPPGVTKTIENRLVPLLNTVKQWETYKQSTAYRVIKNHLEKQENEAEADFEKLKKTYEDEKRKCQESILKFRHGLDSQKDMKQALTNDEEERKVSQQIEDFRYSLRVLEEKANLIEKLIEEGFEYQNAASYAITKDHSMADVTQKILENNKYWFLCSNDILNNRNWLKFSDYCRLMKQEQAERQSFHLAYVDFSYSEYELADIMIIPAYSKSTITNRIVNEREDMNIRVESLKIRQHDNMLNILLLGETRVGKTTFVNMITHYLKFKSYDNVQPNTPNLSPRISFLYKIETEDDERYVSFGTPDRNENYDHTTHSITQVPRSHKIKMNQNTTLNIIDTPGIYMARGNGSEKIDVEYLLSSICTLTHLNAVCILIEADNVNLDIYKRLLEDLLNCFGREITQNIIFCFTKCPHSFDIENRNHKNAEMILQSLNDPIIYTKANTFFFDSTHFIKLITNSFNYDNIPGADGWLSLKDSCNAVLDHIDKKLPTYLLHSLCHKNEYIRMRIIHLIRPLLESIRNIYLNCILYESELKYFVGLHAKSISYSGAICYHCNREYYSINEVRINIYKIHRFVDKCDTCKCLRKYHAPVNYQLQYELSSSDAYDYKTLKNWCNDVTDAIINFGYFLRKNDRNSTCDYFLAGLNLLIYDEQSFYHFDSVNERLGKKLAEFKGYYEWELEKLTKQNKSYDAVTISNWLDYIENIPIIYQQVYPEETA